MIKNPYKSLRDERTEWFREDRFGMFIHWGLYAIPARGEWMQSYERISKEDYQQYFDTFNPTDFNPYEWARAAKNAGMKYVVMTAKHHDGFCLFDSAFTDYKSTNTKCGKDFIKEYLEAFRSVGLKVGLYYSLIDWHHPDYPAYGDSFHPMRDNQAYKVDPMRFKHYLTYMHAQIRELLTNYGRIDIMWYDFSYEEMTGEKWEATELVQMVRSLQPDLIMDNRLDASGAFSGSIMTNDPKLYSGDFASPEQIIPPHGLVDEGGNPIPWEACITLNNNWGYCEEDRLYKSAAVVIRKLVECVSKNGNLMINVGPDASGKIPQESLAILEEIGEWMEKNGESIYGCGKADVAKPDWGRYTQNGNKLYAHLFEENIGPVSLSDMEGQVETISILATGERLEKVRPWNTMEYPRDVFFNFGVPDWFTYPLPDKKDTVIKINLHV